MQKSEEHKKLKRAQEKISKLQKKVERISNKLEDQIIEICEELNYKDSSIFSYNRDRLRMFNEQLQSFKISQIC